MEHPSQSAMNYLSDIKAMRALFEEADHIGVKIIESADPLETFLSNLFSYRPQLIRLLYRIRVFNLLLVNRMAHAATGRKKSI